MYCKLYVTISFNAWQGEVLAIFYQISMLKNIPLHIWHTLLLLYFSFFKFKTVFNDLIFYSLYFWETCN